VSNTAERTILVAVSAFGNAKCGKLTTAMGAGRLWAAIEEYLLSTIGEAPLSI
jgi:hypothetical protein